MFVCNVTNGIFSPAEEAVKEFFVKHNSNVLDVLLCTSCSITLLILLRCNLTRFINLYMKRIMEYLNEIHEKFMKHKREL